MKKWVNQNALLVVVISFFAVAQSHAEMPPAAQEAMKKGVIAAKEKEWEIAIQSFHKALDIVRKAEIWPRPPEIFYNLGLAESKLPGRELRAIAWFGAYLSIATNAPNKAAVNDFITALQIKSEGNISRLLNSLLDAANQIPKHYDHRSILNDQSPIVESARIPALEEVAKRFAQNHNIKKALDIAYAGSLDYKLYESEMSRVMQQVIAYGEAEDIGEARNFINKLESHTSRAELYMAIASKEVGLGEFAKAHNDAKAAIKSGDEPWNCITCLCNVLFDIAKAQYQSGDKKECSGTIAEARDLINDKVKNKSSKEDCVLATIS